MSELRDPSADGTSDQSNSAVLYFIGAVVLESRRTIGAFTCTGALVAFAIVTILGPRYSATASFMPQAGGDSDLSALMGIAGQFGIPLRGGSSAPSPELYAALLTSPIILDTIARESFQREETSGTKESLAILFDVKRDNVKRQHEEVIEQLQQSISASPNRRTGVIALRVRTRWPQVSQRIAQRLIEELNTFNLTKRQSQAKAERRFAEKRAAEARASLRDAEDARRDFAIRNRVQGSPTLTLEAERLGRTVSLRQQLLTSIEQSLESAKLREVQDTPVITVFQQPMVLSTPDPRGRVKFSFLGAFAGLMLSTLYLPLRVFLKRSAVDSSDEAARFRTALKASKHSPLGRTARPSGG
jgi:uncharacterized protein involved in exopolysaccharide biosynthesis